MDVFHRSCILDFELVPFLEALGHENIGRSPIFSNLYYKKSFRSDENRHLDPNFSILCSENGRFPQL